MENFEFCSPTKIIFGRGMESRVGAETKKYANKVLLHYSGGSIKKSGLYEKVTQSLREAGVEFVELGGVQPNPRLSLVREGIALCREHKLEMVLAVGGGSVIDSAKAIALGVPYSGDVWDFFANRAVPAEALPKGVVLTIPAAGSEASKSAVITNEDGWYKWGLNVELNRPQFAIMNPELTFTLPPYQTACGAVDIMAHIMERYFTNVTDVDLTDRLCEGALKSMIRNTLIAIKEPDNYAARAEMMWAGTLAHNDLLGTGRIGDWAAHMIEQEISAIYDVAHGAGLAVVFPAWMKYTFKRNLNTFIKFAVRVWDVDYDFDQPERTAWEGIRRLEDFYRQIGMPVTLAELGVPDDRLEEMARKAMKPWLTSVGAVSQFTSEDILEVLKLAR
ncbi:MAG TPA: iron-containing alcohol dehydrogenase [Bacillota bacterium]|nr:iron-containing alcohol dehydrogenase [Bacillota bacterium]HPT87850.1 iron-containing alcohol dehydrogenase [Bacillota bacterium]